VTREGVDVNQYSIPDEGLAFNLDTLARVLLVADEPRELRMFQNDLVPQRTTVLSDYLECDFAGYTRRTLNRADWTAAEVAADHVARVRLTAGPQMFTPTAAGQIVYGVYLVDVAAGVVRWQGRFATPKTCDVGATFAVNPIITARAVVSEVEV